MNINVATLLAETQWNDSFFRDYDHFGQPIPPVFTGTACAFEDKELRTWYRLYINKSSMGWTLDLRGQAFGGGSVIVSHHFHGSLRAARIWLIRKVVYFLRRDLKRTNHV